MNVEDGGGFFGRGGFFGDGRCGWLPLVGRPAAVSSSAISLGDLFLCFLSAFLMAAVLTPRRGLASAAGISAGLSFASADVTSASMVLAFRGIAGLPWG